MPSVFLSCITVKDDATSKSAGCGLALRVLTQQKNVAFFACFSLKFYRIRRSRLHGKTSKKSVQKKNATFFWCV